MSRFHDDEAIPRLPPLAALRAFESAARLASYSAAAAEICVTDSAVSHQIHALETWLGVALFERQGPKVRLTVVGQDYAALIRGALREIVEATRALREAPTVRRLRISAPPAFAARWLMPRIGDFQALHPQVSVQVFSTMDLADFGGDRIDLALRFGSGQWCDAHAERFLSDEQFPVCSPQFNGGSLPRVPLQLLDVRLLHLTRVPWTPFLQAAGLYIPEPVAALEFSDANVMLHAAIAGVGVALMRRSIIEGELAAGTLVRLFELTQPIDAANYIVWPDHVPPSTDVLAFRDWLLEQAVVTTPA